MILFVKINIDIQKLSRELAVCRGLAPFLHTREVCGLVTSTVEKILRKEEETDRMYNEAKSRCEEILESAKNEAAAVCEKIISEAKKKAGEIIKEAEKESEKLMYEAEADGRKKQGEIEMYAPEKIVNAKSVVLDILF